LVDEKPFCEIFIKNRVLIVPGLPFDSVEGCGVPGPGVLACSAPKLTKNPVGKAEDFLLFIDFAAHSRSRESTHDKGPAEAVPA
jgi:hypothetical protein